MVYDVLMTVELLVLASALPLSVIAALGFRGSPFGKVVTPLPFAIAGFLLADGSLYLYGNGHPTIYYPFAAVGVVAAIYAAFNAMMLLTERRTV